MTETIDPKKVGLRIRDIRKQKGLSMTAFAEKIDKKAKSGTVSNWETGKNLPNNDRLKTIAELGETTVEYILYGSLDEYAKNLLNELEKELKEDDSITDKVAASIISDIEGRLFPKFFPPNYKDRESLEKQFNEYKKNAMNLWKNYKEIDLEIASRIRSQITSDIYGNLEYFYDTTYNKNGEKGQKVSTRADEIVKRLEILDRFQRAYIDVFRFLENGETIESEKELGKKIVKELDKIEKYTDKLRNLNETIDLTELDNI